MIKNTEIKNNFLNLSGARVFRIGVNLFVHTYIVRKLGPELYGKFQFLFNFIAVFVPFVNYALEEVAVKEIVGGEDKNSIISNILLLKLLNAFFCLFLVSIVFCASNLEGVSSLEIASYSIILIFYAFNIGIYDLLAKLKGFKISICQNASFLIGSAFKVLVVHFQLKFFLFLLASTLEHFALALLTFSFSTANFSFAEISFQKIKWLYKKAFLPFFITFFIVLDLALPLVFLRDKISAESYGYVSVAIALINISLFFPLSLSISFYPKLVKLKSLKLFKKLIAAFLTLSLAAILFVHSFGDHLVLLLYGEEFKNASQFLKLLILSTPFYYSQNFLLKAALVFNKEKAFLLFVFLNMLIVSMGTLLYVNTPFGFSYLRVLSPVLLGLVLITFLFFKSNRKDVQI